MPEFLLADDALERATEIATRDGYTPDKQDILHVLLECCPKIVGRDNNEYYAYDDFKNFKKNFEKWIEEKDSSMLRRRRGFKVDKVPDIIEFVESSEYMGMKGSLFPLVKDALWEIWHSKEHRYIECVLSGSTGTGKSFILEQCISYMIMLLSYMWDPQAELSLAPGTPLYIVLQAGNLDQARNILFRPLFNRISASPYFTKHFPFSKDVHSEMIFPNGIFVKPFSGSNDAVLGLTVVGGGITELNRMAYIAKSKRSKSAEDQLYDQAMSIYKTLIRRMVSRTMQLGQLWGKLILDAAHEHEDDFTSQKIKEARENPNIFIYKKAQWEAVPAERFGGDTFMVEVGNKTRRSRMIASMDEAIEPESVINVPEEYRVWFEQDVEGALRDFGGIVIGGQRPAIPFRDKIDSGFEHFNQITGGMQLFTQEKCVIQNFKDPSGDTFELLVNHDYIREVLIDPTIQLVCHYDPALKHDCAGLSVGHIIGWQLLPETKKYNPRTKSYEDKREAKAPIIIIDGQLQIQAPWGEEIDIEAMQNFVIYLKQLINLIFATADGYQSAQMIQSWRRSDLLTGVVSVDDSIEPYTRVKTAYRDDRLYTPRHPVYEREILNLQFENGKFDHLPSGGHSKDVSDSTAGVVFILETHIADYTPLRPDHVRSAVAPRAGSKSGRRIMARHV